MYNITHCVIQIYHNYKKKKKEKKKLFIKELDIYQVVCYAVERGVKHHYTPTHTLANSGTLFRCIVQ